MGSLSCCGIGADCVQLVEEAIDRSGALDVVGERLSDDLLGQVDRGLTEVGPQLGHDLLPLSDELAVTGGRRCGRSPPGPVPSFGEMICWP